MIRTATDHKPSEQASVRQSAGRVVSDLVALAELQWELFRSDARQCASRLMLAAALAGAGLVLLLAAIPIALAALALLLATWMPYAGAFALAALLALIVAGLLVLSARDWLRNIAGAFASSREEFVHSLEWIKGAAKRGQTDDERAARPR